MKFALMGRGGLLTSIVLEKLVDGGYPPEFVAIEKTESKYPNLTERICQKHAIPYKIIEKINSEETLEIIRQNCIKLFVVASLGTILKKELLNTCKFINLHMGILPDYKGAYTNFWKIKNGDDVFGATIHEMTEKIDSGRIIYQCEKDFSDVIHGFDFIRQNYLMAAEGLMECIRSGKIEEDKKETSPLPKGNYFPKYTEKDFEIDFSKTCFDNYKIINRLQFYGNPFFYFNNEKKYVVSAQLLFVTHDTSDFIGVEEVSINKFLYYGIDGILELTCL